MTAPIVTSTTDSQMHNNIMAAGLYTLTTVVVPVVPATENSPAVPKQITVETVMNMTPENRAHFELEKEAIHLILTGIEDEIYSTVDAYVKTNLFWEFGQFTSHDGETIESYYTRFYKMMNEMIRNNLTVATMQVNVQFLQQLQPEWSRFVTIVKQQHKLDEVSYHKLFDILKQYQKEVNELRAERMAKNSASEEDSDPEQAQRDKEMQKNLALIAKYFKKIYKPTNNNLRTSSNTRNKNVDSTPRYKNDNQTRQFGNQRAVNVAGAREIVGVQVVQQSRIQCFNCKEFGHFAKECRKPKRVKDSTYHKEKMLLCKQAEKDEVPNADSGTDSEPLEHVQYDIDDNVSANDIQHFEQSKSINNTCAVETECDDERVELANLIANLKLDVDENKKIQKQLKKANATLTQELTECKSILAETSITLGESNSIRDSCLVALQNKQTEFERYKAFNDRTVDYDKLERKLNETLGLLAQKEIDIKEGLKVKAYEISVVKEKHDELVKQSLLTKSHYEGLVKEKTKNDSFAFVHELKQEMHADLKYVESLKDGIDELKSDKAEFSNMYDMLLQECVSNAIMCSYLQSSSDLDEITELQCLYLYKVRECDCLAQKLSEQTEFVSKEIYTKLLRSFAKLEKNSISLEIALQQCQEQLKNDTVCKEKASNAFRKEREQYFEIQDLKAQLQDKNIAICELKKLIEKCKGKSMETKFDKPSVVRQPNAQRIPKPSVLGKPSPFSDSLERKNFANKKLVLKTNESEGLSKPVTSQNLPQTATQAVSNTNVIKPGMYQTASSTTQTRAPQLTQTSRNTNPHVSTSTRVAHKTNVSRPQLRSNQMKDKVMPNTSHVKFKKTEVEEHPRISSISIQIKSITACNNSLNSRTSNVNVVCATYGKCVFNSNHDACVSKFLNDVNARTKKPKVVPISTRKPKSQANKSVATYQQQCPSGYKWVPKTKKKWVPKVRNENLQKRVSFAIDNASRITNIVQLILFIVDSGCTKHMTGNLSLLCNFVEKYLGTVRFGNDQFAPILGYGDLVQGNITINRVYYVEGLNHNLFSVGQFCDADLEVAFRKSTCFVRDLQGNDLLTGNRGTDLYTISLQETTSSTPICLMAKASPTQAWLWHRRLSHLNFDYINLLSKKDVVIGLPKLKYVKDQLCSSCEVSKAKRSSFKSKTVPSSKGRLNLLHMDLCGPMRVASINGKKYILVIVKNNVVISRKCDFLFNHSSTSSLSLNRISSPYPNSLLLSDKLESAYNTIIIDCIIVLIFEVGERLVLFEEVIDDDFGKLRVWHIFTSRSSFLPVINLVSKVFLNQLKIVDILSVEHAPHYVNPRFSESIIACRLPRETLINMLARSSPWLTH
ncbi:retrovirus-related pol polyprotein from transposon TNT 1-94 [Tanacetum coccineum]